MRRDTNGRFIKGEKQDFKRTDKQLQTALKNLSDWIGREPPMTGKKHSDSTKERMSIAKEGYIPWNKGKKCPNVSGDKHWKWISDRSKVKCNNLRNDPAYQVWVKSVKKRDDNKCKLKDENCSGYNIVHHIYGWAEYPELRYNINNGITLCQAHHPRTRAKEKRLIPILEGLVSVSSEII
jgi:hypothetical protein